MSDASVTSTGRITALDGLRGIAAVLVVAWHSALLVPAFCNDSLGQNVVWSWYDPANLLRLGTQAVFLFFALSGFVLTRAYVGRSIFTRSYFASRLARLYLPIWASVLLAVILQLVFSSPGNSHGSSWLTWESEPITARSLLSSLTVIFGTSHLNSSLWSMTYEVAFSILLPLVLLVVPRVTGKFLTLGILAMLAAIVIAPNQMIAYLPMFVCGSLLARCRVRQLSGVWPMLVLVLAFVLFSSTWTVTGFLGVELDSRLAAALVTLGSLLLIYLSLTYTPLQSGLESRLCQALGQRSFSIYLVQGILIVAVGNLSLRLWSAEAVPWSAVAIVAAVVGVSGGWIFYPIEKRAHALSRSLSVSLTK